MQAVVVLAGLLGLSQIAAVHEAAARPVAVAQQVLPLRGTLAESAPKATAPAPAPEPSACRLRLAKIATFHPLGALVGSGGCGAADAVLLQSVILPDQAKVEVEPPATLRCTMADAVAQWVRDDAAPAALRLGSRLRAMDQIDSYECRSRDRVKGAKLSEHARGNALDVRAFRLANGESLVLVDPNVPAAFRAAVRAGACARFMTVLGPGSDSYHAEHVHIDLEARHNNYKICEWDLREPAVQAQAVAPTRARASLVPKAAPRASAAIPLPRPRPHSANVVARSLSPTPHRRRRRASHRFWFELRTDHWFGTIH